VKPPDILVNHTVSSQSKAVSDLVAVMP